MSRAVHLLDRANLQDFYDSSLSSYYDSAIVEWLADERVKYLPALAGGYPIQGAVSLSGAVTMEGDGSTESYFVQQTAAANGIVNGSGKRLFGVKLNGVGVRMKNGTAGGIGLDLSDVSNSTFYDLAVFCDSTTDGFATGVRNYGTPTLGGSYRNHFFGARIRTIPGAGSVGVLSDGAANDYGANGCQFFGGEIRADQGKGVHLKRVTNQFGLYGVAFEGATAQAVEITGDSSSSQGNLVTGCRFEGVVNGVLMDATSVGNLIMGNLYASGLTTRVVDLGSRNFVIEPSASGGNAVALSRGDFVTRSGRFLANPSLANAAIEIFAAYLGTDANPTFQVKANGRFSWGPGGATPLDATLYRIATGSVGLESGKWIDPLRIFADGATSPDVSNGNYFACANSAPTSVVSFTGSQDGQGIEIHLDANTTIVHGPSMQLAGGVNLVGTAGTVLTLRRRGTIWREVTRSVNA